MANRPRCRVTVHQRQGMYPCHLIRFCKTGLVAILRGVKPDEIVAIGENCHAAGFRLIEIPMNSPEALQSISLLRDAPA